MVQTLGTLPRCHRRLAKCLGIPDEAKQRRRRSGTQQVRPTDCTGPTDALAKPFSSIDGFQSVTMPVVIEL